MVIIVSFKMQKLFSCGLSLEHIGSEQRIEASICKTKEAAWKGGLERRLWLTGPGATRPGWENRPAGTLDHSSNMKRLH